MHVAACSPKYLSSKDVSSEEVEQEKEISRKIFREQGKPDNIIEKILLGQVQKFYSEICLLDQAFVKNPDLSVKKHLKQAGSGLEIIDFVKFRLGEGIEVKKANLAEEVASQVANSSKS